MSDHLLDTRKALITSLERGDVVVPVDGIGLFLVVSTVNSTFRNLTKRIHLNFLDLNDGQAFEVDGDQFSVVNVACW